jgi:hypothetical protein
MRSARNIFSIDTFSVFTPCRFIVFFSINTLALQRGAPLSLKMLFGRVADASLQSAACVRRKARGRSIESRA